MPPKRRKIGMGHLLTPHPAKTPLTKSTNRAEAPSKNSKSHRKTPTKTKEAPKPPSTIRRSNDPITLSPPTPSASRTRHRSRLTRELIFSSSHTDSTHEESAIVDHAATFGPGSHAHLTWGIASGAPVKAVGTRRRHGGVRAFCRGRARKGGAFARFMWGEQAGEGSDADGADKGAGDEAADAFPFLRLPLEIRWKVYAYLLIHDRPILVHYDWSQVHVASRREHAVLRTCSQVLVEACGFLYEQNVFHALLRPEVRSAWDEVEKKRIAGKFLPLLKNVVIECRTAYFGVEWLNATADSIQILVAAESILDSLAMVITPRRLSMTQTLLGMESRPVAFADFFFAGSRVMTAITLLRCKVLNIILRLPGKKRLLVSINMRGIPVNQIADGWLSQEKVSVDSRKQSAWEVRKELRALKQRIENVVDDPEKAAAEGKARILDDDEACGDGMRLAERASKSKEEGASVEEMLTDPQATAAPDVDEDGSDSPIDGESIPEAVQKKETRIRFRWTSIRSPT